jgi:hypothetical protein
MATLIEQIEELRIRVNGLANNEHGLVRALGDALSRADQNLLREVRNLTVEHEVRRGAILQELQILASRMGTFPQPRGLENAQRDLSSDDGAGPAVGRGDWRRAAARIN